MQYRGRLKRETFEEEHEKGEMRHFNAIVLKTSEPGNPIIVNVP
jgi:hypothetical protein